MKINFNRLSLVGLFFLGHLSEAFGQNQCRSIYSQDLRPLSLSENTLLYKVSDIFKLDPQELVSSQEQFSDISIAQIKGDLKEINRKIDEAAQSDVQKKAHLKQLISSLQESGFLFGPIHQILYMNAAELTTRRIDFKLNRQAGDGDVGFYAPFSFLAGGHFLNKSKVELKGLAIFGKTTEDAASRDSFAKKMSQLKEPTFEGYTANEMGFKQLANWHRSDSSEKITAVAAIKKTYGLTISEVNLMRQIDSFLSISKNDREEVLRIFLPEIHEVIHAKSQGRVSRWASRGAMIAGAAALTGVGLALNDFHSAGVMGQMMQSNWQYVRDVVSGYDYSFTSPWTILPALVASTSAKARQWATALPNIKANLKAKKQNQGALGKIDTIHEAKEKAKDQASEVNEQDPSILLAASMDEYFNQIKLELKSPPTKGVYELGIYGRKLTDAADVINLRIQHLSEEIKIIESDIQRLMSENINSSSSRSSIILLKAEASRQLDKTLSTMAALLALRDDVVSYSAAYDRYIEIFDSWTSQRQLSSGEITVVEGRKAVFNSVSTSVLIPTANLIELFRGQLAYTMDHLEQARIGVFIK